MAELTFNDLAILASADLKKGVLPNILEWTDPTSMNRLVQIGLSDEDGNLTPKGTKAATALGPFFNDMEKGIPLKRRVRNEAREAELHNSSKVGWIFGEYKKKAYVTNSELFIFIKPTKTMKATPGKSASRKAIADTLRSQCSGKSTDYLELFPVAFQFEKITKSQIVWLRSKKGDYIAAVQAKYFDFIKEKYPSATFHVNTKRQEKFVPVQARVKNRGLKFNVVALMMVLELDNNLTIPEVGGDSGEM